MSRAWLRAGGPHSLLALACYSECPKDVAASHSFPPPAPSCLSWSLDPRPREEVRIPWWASTSLESEVIPSSSPGSRGRERSSGHQQAGEERVSRPPPGDQEGSPLFCKLRITEFANLGKGTVGPWRTLGDWLGQKDLLPKPSAPSDVCRGEL